jgi:hypothetical protein
VAGAVVAIHPRDVELRNGSPAGDGIGERLIGMRVHMPVYPSTLAAAVKFALTGGVAFH